MARSAIIIGLSETCRRLERQLDLMPTRPASLGWVLVGGVGGKDAAEGPNGVLGRLEDLEAIVERLRPDLALVTLPAVFSEQIAAIRTRLRSLGVRDRFLPTLEDLVDGVGPRNLPDLELARLLDRSPRIIDEDAVRRLIRSKRVLITGAGGTIGSELGRAVCHWGSSGLILVERSENALFEIDRQVARLAPDLPRTALLHDVVDAAGTLEHFRRLEPQIIFHAAAHKHVPMMEDHPAAAVDNNLFGTRSVADAADAVNAERFVLISTDKAINPRSIMGATKRLAELYVQHLDARSRTAFAIVRFGNVLGSTGSVLDVWSREIAEGGPLTVTDPRMTRYFMTIPEAARLVFQAAALPDPGAVFLLDMGEPIRVVDLARRFIELHALSPETVGIVFTGARPGEKLHEELPYDTGAVRPTGHPDVHAWRLPLPEADYVDHLIGALAPSRRPRAAGDVAELVHRLVRGRLQPAAA